MAVFQYDPKLMAVIYAGNIITGFADGDFAEAKRSSDKMSKYIGADGQVTVVKSADDSGEVTITLAQSSASNAILTAIYNLQQLPGAAIGAPLMIKDLLGTTLLSAQNAWIKKLPDTNFGKELGTRAWPLDCANLQMNV